MAHIIHPHSYLNDLQDVSGGAHGGRARVALEEQRVLVRLVDTAHHLLLHRPHFGGVAHAGAVDGLPRGWCGWQAKKGEGSACGGQEAALTGVRPLVATEVTLRQKHRAASGAQSAHQCRAPCSSSKHANLRRRPRQGFMVAFVQWRGGGSGVPLRRSWTLRPRAQTAQGVPTFVLSVLISAISAAPQAAVQAEVCL